MANKFQDEYFMSLAQQAKADLDLMKARARKYNGVDWEDPFAQISDASFATGVSVETGIRFMVNMKISRFNIGEDAVDDPLDDSLRDASCFLNMLREYRRRQKTVRELTVDEPRDLVEVVEKPSAKGTLKNLFGLKDVK